MSAPLVPMMITVLLPPNGSIVKVPATPLKLVTRFCPAKATLPEVVPVGV